MCKTDYGGGGGGGNNALKIDYVICERPLSLVKHSYLKRYLLIEWAHFKLKSVPFCPLQKIAPKPNFQ